MNNDTEMLVLKNQEILYCNKRDEKYKYDSLTLRVYGDDEQAIEDWAKLNKIGNDSDEGKSPIKPCHIAKDAPTVPAITCKLHNDTEIFDSAGQQVSFSDITTKSIVNVAIRPYAYDSKEYGSGTSYYLTSIMVVKAEPNQCREDAKALLEMSYNDSNTNTKGEAAVEEEKIDLDDVPF